MRKRRRKRDGRERERECVCVCVCEREGERSVNGHLIKCPARENRSDPMGYRPKQ